MFYRFMIAVSRLEAARRLRDARLCKCTFIHFCVRSAHLLEIIWAAGKGKRQAENGKQTKAVNYTHYQKITGRIFHAPIYV